MVRMLDWSRITSEGKMTWVGPMLASPGRGATTKRIGGLKLRRVERRPLPRFWIAIWGLKPSRAHSPTWKRLERFALCPRVEVSLPVTAMGLQEVGFKVKFGRFIRIEI